MENASKALLIAGGMLIALLIIGALVLMFNQIGDYEKGQKTSAKTSSLAEFNADFERYTDDNMINGADIISLINKVIDYNKKAENGEITNSVDYNIKMSITVSGLKNFNDTYAYTPRDTDQLFEENTYTFGAKATETNTNKLKDILDNCSFAETSTGISIGELKELSGIYDKGNKEDSKDKIKEKLFQIDSIKYADWDGTNKKPTLDTIIKYRQYSEFKSSKFKSSKGSEYKNGQITHMYFKFVK